MTIEGRIGRLERRLGPVGWIPPAVIVGRLYDEEGNETLERQARLLALEERARRKGWNGESPLAAILGDNHRGDDV